MKNYWIFKIEPANYSIDHLQKDRQTAWSGIRNYQARNFMRKMNKGDMVLFYHSGANPAVVGLAKVAILAHPDTTALDSKGEYYDENTSKENPIWEMVDIAFVRKFVRPVTLDQIKFDQRLKGITLAKKGSRLSIQPVSEAHFHRIFELSNIK